MWYDDKASLVLQEKLFEDVEGNDVEVISRLVEYQEIWIFDKNGKEM